MKTRLLILILAALPLTGCETLVAWQSKPGVQFAEAEAIKLAASFFSNGGNVDSGWGVSNGLNLIGDIATYAAQKNLPDPNAAAAITVGQAVRQFSGNPKAVAGLANSLASVVEKAAPQTPAERAKIVLAIASGVGKATAATVK